METRFGKWLKSKGFVVFFITILVTAIGYMGFRLGNALEWGTGLQLYAPISILLILMFFMLFTHIASNDNRFIRRCRFISAYFLCFVLYDVLILMFFDLVAVVFHFGKQIKAVLIFSAGILTVFLLIYGSIHALQINTVTYTVDFGKKDERNRIVLLSDLHIGIFVNTAYLEKVTDAVNQMTPDLIVISGDIFDGYMPADDNEVRCISDIFQQMRATLGIYAVTGNHDPDITDKRFLDFMKNSGIKLLYNKAEELPEWNLIGRAGIVDMKNIRVPLCNILGNVNPRKPTIVLDHDPQGIREAAAYGVELILCGHTHKGQFFPMTFLTKLANGAQYFYGYRIFGRTHSVISAGTGFFRLPVRIGTDSEIILLEIGG